MTPLKFENLTFGHKAIVIGLIACACIVTLFPLPLFSGAALIFGNIIAVALTIVLGGRIGVVTTLLATSLTYFNWGHFLAVPPFLFEVLVVYFCIKRRRSPLTWGGVYWITLGVATVAFLFFTFTNFLFITKVAITIKFVINGVINILVGYALAHGLTLWLQRRPLRTLRLSSFISLSVIYAVTFSVFANAYYWLQLTQEDKLKELQNQMSLEAQHVAEQIASYLASSQRSLALLSMMHGKNENEAIQDNLKIVAEQHPDFLTMLATNSIGDVIATYPAYLIENIDANTNVSDRRYFTDAQLNLAPVLSPVFKGRGFGDDPIVAISAPIIQNDRFSGIYEASLELSFFADFDQKRIDSSQSLVILDDSNNVVFSSSRLMLEPLQNMTGSKLEQYLARLDDYYFIDELGEYLIVKHQDIADIDWKVVVLVPRNFYEYQISKMAVGSLTILCIFILILYFLMHRFARRVSKPITELTKSIAAAAENRNFESMKLERIPSYITEFNRMTPIIQRFSHTLGRTLNKVRLATLETQSANKQLAALNSNLTQIVADKTRELEVALHEANYANKSKSKFLANMSHEIRTPMNGVLGMLELLNLTELDDVQRHKVSIAQSSAKALLGLINDILDLSKLDAGKMSFEKIDFEMCSLISEITATQTYLLEKDEVSIVLDFDAQQALWCIGDPMRVRQVLTNLLSNAVKFTTHGEITVGLTSNLIGQTQTIRLSVTDTGIGIDDKKLSALFNAFTQADESTTRKYGGTGLGLTIAKQLCYLMGGDLTVTSVVGQGSQFVASFEFEKGAYQEPTTNDNPLTFEISGLNILLVEDNNINQIVAQKMLLSLGCNVIVANNGLEALDMLKDRRNLDLILMDCQMPEMDGFEATQIIRIGDVCSEYQDITIIALTANAMKGDEQRCLDAGMNGFIAKPIDIDVLKTTIQHTLTKVKSGM